MDAEILRQSREVKENEQSRSNIEILFNWLKKEHKKKKRKQQNNKTAVQRQEAKTLLTQMQKQTNRQTDKQRETDKVRMKNERKEGEVEMDKI